LQQRICLTATATHTKTTAAATAAAFAFAFTFASGVVCASFCPRRHKAPQ
jgi:hypothetical protein